MMKKPLMPSLALCVAFLGGPNAAFADQACSQETLFGSYLFYATGADKNGKPTAFAGIDYYDGKGGILSTTTYSNGKSSNGTGTYRVDRNCKAEARYSDKSRNTYFISPTGDELVWVDTAGDTTAGPEKRISKDNLTGRK